MATTATNPVPSSTGSSELNLASIDHTLDACRSRVDELKVQLDLAKLDVRDDVDQKLAVAQNAYLAARSKLADTRHDAGTMLHSLRKDLDALLIDLGQAFDEVDAVVKRGV